jgi:ferredoxin-like protein FixX
MATCQVTLDAADFERDAHQSLGNANGNIFVRKAGVSREHDGQVMVRLKKKRFIVLDYSLQPNEADMNATQSLAHVEIPSGAGKTVCTTKECVKVGVPVKLYDSNPDDSVSLYLRNGLCFECQRNINEKRRVDRKRKPEGPTLLFSLTGPNQKKFKVNGSDNIIELKQDAIIINGSMKGVKTAAAGNSYQEIAMELQDLLRDSTLSAERMLATAETLTASPTTTSTGPDAELGAQYERAFVSMNKAIFLMAQWKVAFDTATNASGSSATSTDPNNGHMVSLLLAADKDQQKATDGSKAVKKEEEKIVADEVDIPSPPDDEEGFMAV